MSRLQRRLKMLSILTCLKLFGLSKTASIKQELQLTLYQPTNFRHDQIESIRRRQITCC